MEKSYCELLLQYFPKAFEFDNLRSTIIANCILNSFLSFSAIMLNILTIHAIRKTSSLPKTLKTLLLSLVVSDVGVGLLGQPLYISLLVKWFQLTSPACNTYMAFGVIVSVFASASFLSVVALSVDRLLAIHLHLRYQELVTHKRVVAVAISIWVFSLFIALMKFWVPLDIYVLIELVIGVGSFLFTTVAYTRIYLAAQYHKHHIQALQVQQVIENGEIANFARVIKSAVGTFYVHLVFLMCCLPYFINIAVIKVNGPSVASKLFFLFSLTLMFLNSSLNPVIFCWKMRHIRHTIMDILRNTSWLRNLASHWS